MYTDGGNDINAALGADAEPQITVLTMQIQTFLCPSDTMNPGASGLVNLNGTARLIGSFNYPSNVGLNRYVNSPTWQANGPGYVITNWDTILIQRQVSINTFTDGTSNTAIFSEWVKGPGTSTVSRPTLGMIYNIGVGFRATGDRPAIRVDLCGRQAAPNEPNRYLRGLPELGLEG